MRTTLCAPRGSTCVVAGEPIDEEVEEAEEKTACSALHAAVARLHAAYASWLSQPASTFCGGVSAEDAEAQSQRQRRLLLATARYALLQLLGLPGYKSYRDVRTRLCFGSPPPPSADGWTRLHAM
eukprot:COSAG05_NODE_506_length_9178_cov_36.187576_9_plen_125_part_00